MTAAWVIGAENPKPATGISRLPSTWTVFFVKLHRAPDSSEEAQSANALEVACFLETHPNVDRVCYPGLESFPQKELADRQASGHGSMLWFEVHGGVEAGKKLAEQPNAMLLRYFGALHDVAGNRTSTIVFPIPMDLLGSLKS